MSDVRKPKLHLMLGASLGALLLTPAAALSQTGTPGAAAPPPAPEDAEIVVTGSRLNVRENAAISPVRILSGDEIRASVELDIDELLKTQNQFLPSNGATTNPTLLESHGASTIDMRGLGQNRTLVLVNGQRATPNGFRNSVDVNTIPSAMIARIETLTGGAAAVYGADAVAGVTNFILRDTYEGLEATASANSSGKGDAQSWSVGLTGGRNFLDDKLNVVVHASYTDRGGMLRKDRDWAVPEVNDLGLPLQTFPTAGGSFQRWASATAAPGATAAPAFAFSSTGALQATSATQSFSDLEAFQNPNDRTNFSVFSRFEAAKFAEFYVRANYSLINNTSQQVPVRTNGNPAAQDVLIQRTNPFITPQILAAINAAGGFNLNAAGTGAGTDAVRLRVAKTLTEFGPLTDQTEREMFQYVAGVKGDVTDWLRYDLSYVSGKNIERVTRNGWGTLDRFLQATNATTTGGQAACVNPANGCVPFNLFGPNAASAQSVAWILGSPDELFNKRNRHQDVLSLVVSGDSSALFSLPGGPISFAVGAERREEWGNSVFGLRAGNRNHLHTQGARANLDAKFALDEQYAEIRLPLVKDLPAFKQFDVELAGRQSQHSRSGDYETWKVGLNWRVLEDLRLRGSKQSVVRGPNIGEFFGAAVAAPITGTGRPIDYCADPARYNVPVSLCRALGAPSTPGYLPLVGGVPLIDGAVAIQGGGDAIKPESGETYTYGFVLTPRFVPGLSVLVDYWNVRLDDAIGTINPIQLMESCYLIVQNPSSPLCTKIRRNAAGLVVEFDQRDTNLTLLQTSGIDITIDYRADLPEGLPGERIAVNFYAGITDEFTRLDHPAANRFDCAGKFGASGICGDAGTSNRAIPGYRHNMAVSWVANDKLTLRGNWRVTGEVDAVIGTVLDPRWRGVTPNTNLVQHIPTWDYFDLGFTYFINKDLRVSGTVNNVFDRDPPILGNAQADANTLPNQYDIIGRRFGVNLTWRM
jgi:outer membrane receptor protein involved in Fe transport